MKATSTDVNAAVETAAADDHPDVSAANARAGLVLFFIYLAFYAGFMGLAAFAPQAMGRPVLAGVNLAITYGMGLIVGALVIAAVYMGACALNAQRYGKREASAARVGKPSDRFAALRGEGRP